MEEAVVDTRTGAFVNRDLAEYLVPVHADIPEIDAVLLDGFDDKANVLGAKGVGELGNCGAECGGRERGVQRHRRARARLPHHAREGAAGLAARGRLNRATKDKVGGFSSSAMGYKGVAPEGGECKR